MNYRNLLIMNCLFIMPLPINGQQKTLTRQLPGMIGNQPYQICKLIDAHKKRQNSSCVVKIKPASQRFILKGPPGNGKNLLAQVMANELEATYISIIASSLVNEYQGSGAQAIEQLFNKADSLTATGKPVLIFIDEIDAIASIEIDKNQTDSYKALQTLWCQLIKHEYNPLLYVVFATNNYEKLDPTFLNRFKPSNIIEKNNPDEKERYDVLKKGFAAYNIPLFNDLFIKKLIDSLEPQLLATCDEFNVICSDLNKLSEKLFAYATSDESEKAELLGDITKLQHKIIVYKTLVPKKANNILNPSVKSEITNFIENSEAQPAPKPINISSQLKTIQEIFDLTESYVEQVNIYLKTNYISLDETQLKDIVTNTEGLSYRSLFYIISESFDDNGFTNISLINNAITEAKQKNKLELNNKAEKEKQKMLEKEIKELTLQDLKQKIENWELELASKVLSCYDLLRRTNGIYSMAYPTINAWESARTKHNKKVSKILCKYDIQIEACNKSSQN